MIVAVYIIANGTAYGLNDGFPLNPARDLGPRLFTYCAGYGTEVWTANHYWFWVPLVAPIIGGIVGSFLY